MIIWVLTDSKIGSSKQGISLAKQLTNNFIIKNISYNVLGKLPNIILNKFNNIHVNKNKSDDLSSPFPDMVISTCRRTATIALNIKQQCNSTKIIQLLKPLTSNEKFDLIITPKHDHFKGKNVIEIIGVLTDINDNISKDYPDFKLKYKDNFIAVLIGGNNKQYCFTDEDINIFINYLKQISNKKLFISFSRRTPNELKNLCHKYFKEHYIYDPSSAQDIQNPYYPMIKYAEGVICTGDSISMCSEIATAGKPLYIFLPNKLSNTKHGLFVHNLIETKIAKLIPDNFPLKHYPYTPLNELTKVVKYIKNNLIK